MTVGKPKVLLIVGGPFHDGPGAREILQGVLSSGGLLDVTVTDKREVFAPSTLAGYDAVAIYTTGPGLTDAQLGALLDYVAGGKGLVGIHSAADSFKEHAAYLAMLGSRFVSHPPFGDVQVNVADQQHPITRGMGNFAVQDERYVLELQPEGLHVLATAAKDGKAETSMYVKQFGGGRVFYCGLGHDRQSHQDEHVGRLYRRGLQWAAGRDVTA